jgi:hypothetical protein
MAEVQAIDWPGLSGKTYRYWIYPIGTTFDGKPGNYAFAKESSPNTWVSVYFGQTGDLSERFENHHKASCARRNGATHIHVHMNKDGEAARLREERDLIAKWRPVCND